MRRNDIRDTWTTIRALAAAGELDVSAHALRAAQDEAIAPRELAETIATRANEAAKGGDPAIVDTLARVLFMRGKKAEALTLEEKAVKLAEGDMQKQFQQVLDSYKRGDLPKPD